MKKQIILSLSILFLAKLAFASTTLFKCTGENIKIVALTNKAVKVAPETFVCPESLLVKVGNKQPVTLKGLTCQQASYQFLKEYNGAYLVSAVSAESNTKFLSLLAEITFDPETNKINFLHAETNYNIANVNDHSSVECK